MIKDSEWLCPNCEIVSKYASLKFGGISGVSGSMPALRTTCDMCGGQYLIIEEVKPTLTSFEANLKFQGIAIVKEEDGRKSKSRKMKAKK